MSSIKSLAVFCGSNAGNNPIYIQTAIEVGAALARANITLVYGGSKVGLMGVVANAALERGGKVIGVLPEFMKDKELAHTSLTELHIVETMHARKALMSNLSDGYIMLPGGSGSLEEFFEIWTGAQLGLHLKPCGIINIKNYYDHILKFIDHSVESQFIKPIYRDMLIVENSPETMLEKFAQYQPPTEKKWINMKEVELQTQVFK